MFSVLQLREKSVPPVAISLVYTTTHVPVLRWAGRGGSRVKGALALLSAVRLAIAFFSLPMIGKRTRRRSAGPVHVAVEEQRLDGEGERTPALPCSPRPVPVKPAAVSPPPNDSPLLPGTLARRNDCEQLISGVLTAVRPW